MNKCVVISEIPVAYRTGWFDHIHASSKLDLSVAYLAAGQRDRSWERIPDAPWATFLESRTIGATRRGHFARVTAGLWDFLDEHSPSFVVLPGWAHPASWQALAWCRRHDVPAGVMFETWKSQRETRLPSALTRSVRSQMFARTQVAMPIGRRAERFAIRAGATNVSVVHGNTCDSEGIAADTSARSRSMQGAHVSFVGRLMEHKGARVLLDTLPSLSAAGVQVTVAGDGPLLSEFERAESQSIRVLGAVSPSEVRQLLVESDALLMPSLEEPWGVVLHEALSAGTPVVASTEVGSVDDFLDASQLGLVIVEPTAQALAVGVSQLLESGSSDSRREAATRAGRSVSYRSATAELVDVVRRYS